MNSPSTISGSSRSLQRCVTSRFFIYTCVTLWVHPSAQIWCPKVKWAVPFQDCYETMLWMFLISKKNFTPLYSIFLSLAFLLRASLSPSAAGPSCPPCQTIPWAQITTAEQLWVELPLQMSGERLCKRLFKKHKKKIFERIVTQILIELISISEAMQSFVLQE